MRLFFLLAIAGVALLSVPHAMLAKDNTETVLSHAVDDVIRPGYHRFLDETASMLTTMDTLCANPSKPDLDSARAAFTSSLASWGAVEIFRIGPALEKNRFERVLYYPDRKSIGLKQIQTILNTKDETATAPETLAIKSVGVQGFGALDYVLYGKGFETLTSEADSHRCRFGLAITKNLHAIANDLTTEWDRSGGIADSWKTPGPQNPVFRNEQEAITELLGVMVHGAEMVRDQRIRTFYPEEKANPNPKLALLWRSGQTWTMIGANLEGLSTLWKKSHMEILLKEDQRSVATSIGFVLKSMARISTTINPDIAIAVSAPDERAKLDFLLLNASDLIGRLSDDYGKALGLGAGFSFSDGD